MTEEQRLRPAPWVTRDSAFFWEAAKRDEFVGQCCADCGSLRSPPRPMCPECNSVKSETRSLSGRGTVYSWVIPRHPPVPGFEATYIVAVIDLEEGIRFVSNLCDIEYDDVTPDMPVEVFFEDTRDGFRIPLFRPVRS
jgi:uncharacterized OB-fold protein